MRRIAVVLLAAVMGLQCHAQSIRDDLKRMDAALATSEEHLTSKENQMASLRKMLYNEDLRPEQRYEILRMLFTECFTYKFDDAIILLGQMEDIATQLHSEELLNETRLYQAETYTTAGMFLEAQNLIDNVIDTLALTDVQKIHFFNIGQRFCGDYREYSDNMEVKAGFVDRQSFYRSRIFAELDSTNIEYKRVLMQTLLDEGNLDVAEMVCDQALASLGTSEHRYAVFTYYKAFISEERGDVEAAVHWYVESAICDIKCGVKDNASLISLAKVILPMREVERSFRYTQIALGDALFYNARLRPFQIARTLPDIQNAYDRESTRRQRIDTVMIIVMSLIAVLLFVFVVIAVRANLREKSSRKKIEAIQADLKQAVAKLSEANEAKEVYLGLFLSMCSNYLDKLRKHVTRAEMDEELKNFYNTFDNAFLHLYPNFVADFNSLLKEEYAIELKKDELLNTELRIFALIRLGITQSSHIASLLRYSVNTIYNYRAQVKKMSRIDPETFEERVKSL